jgi:LPS export ABC transporter permease LptF/LPS export ABC transporter permease LptG
MQAEAQRDAEPSAAEPRDARRWRLGPKLFRYIVRELVFPTMFALLGLTLLAIATDLIGFADLVVNRGWGMRQVAEIAVFRVTPMLGRVIPFSVLLGSLVAIGRLGADRELLALEASGVSARRLAAPVAAFAAVLAAGALGITAVAAPAANRALDAAMVATAKQSSGTVLRSGVVNSFGAWRIQAEEVSSRGDRLRGVLLWVPSMGQTVFAQNATIEPDASGGKRVLIENGVVLRQAEDGPAYLRFDRMQEVMSAESDQAAEPTDWLSAAPLSELAAAARSSSDQRRDAAAELHRRIALPLAALLFGLLAVPLFLARGQHSRAGGMLLGLISAVVYFGLLQLSNALARAEDFPVALAAWLPDLVLAATALLLLARTRRSRSGRRLLRAPWRRPRAARERPLRARRFVLDRYVGLRFAELAVLCFAALLVAFVLVDVIDNLQWFTKYRSTLDEVTRFYAARMPLLISRVVPMALLVSAALTMSLLGVTGELLGLRACGVPTLRTVMPILALCGVVALCYQAIVDRVVPHATARARQIKRIEIKNQASEQVSVWTRKGDHLYEIDRFDPLRGVAQGLTLYEVGSDGMPHSRTDAAEARHIGGGVWQLRDPERIEVSSEGPRFVPADSFAELGHDLQARVEGSEFSIDELREEIRVVEQRGYTATPYRVDLNVKLAAPLACVVLPALALLFATGGPPFPRPAQILVMSAAVGVGHLLLSAVGTSLGYGGAVPPIVAGWGPIAALLAVALLIAGAARLRRHR